MEYYDAFLVGLTATPDKRTFGFFNENVVSEYTYEESVADGVNVPYDVFTIETEITQQGAEIKAKEYIDKREKLSRQKRWEQLDEDYQYTANKLDKEVVNLSQIRNIIKAYKDALPSMFPDRYDEKGEFEVPKTLIFAKTDSHADDIIQIVREEFAEGNDFCKKITYKTDEDPKSVLNRFRNSWAPRIAVTVDMIATGTDVKPLEVLLFMRDVRSSNYFEQMKGRGTCTINFDDLKKVTRTAKHTKTHFVIVDAVGATKSKKTDSRPLEKKPSVPLKDLLGAITMGAQGEDLFLSIANRLIRLEKQLTTTEKENFETHAQGKTMRTVIKELLNAYNPDAIEDKTNDLWNQIPPQEQTEEKREETEEKAKEQLVLQAAITFTGQLNEYIENVRKVHEQIIDTINLDTVLRAEWSSYTEDKAKELVKQFSQYIEENKDEIIAFSIFYDQPYQRRELTYKMVKEVLEKIKLEKPIFAPRYIWEAFEAAENTKVGMPKSELVTLVSLIRRTLGIDSQLTPYSQVVDRNFQDWTFKKQAGTLKFNSEQMEWLRMLKEHIATSFHVTLDDLDYTPFDSQGGKGKMYQLFGKEMNQIINELNQALVA